MWETIRQSVKGKACILTTHSMEEAEELSSTIGILIQGEFECMGTAQDLKNKYGEGLQLEAKVPVSRVDEYKAFVTKIFGSFEISEEHYGRITFKIPAPEVFFFLFLSFSFFPFLIFFRFSLFVHPQACKQTNKLKLKQKPLGEIFSALEQARHTMEVEEYSLSQTTLEQIFISLAKKQDEVANQE